MKKVQTTINKLINKLIKTINKLILHKMDLNRQSSLTEKIFAIKCRLCFIRGLLLSTVPCYLKIKSGGVWERGNT